MNAHRDPHWLARVGQEHVNLRHRGVRHGHATDWLRAREGVSSVAVLLAVAFVERQK